MKILYILLFSITLFACGSQQVNDSKQTASMATAENEKSFYDFKLKSLMGAKDIPLSDYKGKKVLLVNVASKCGFTPQYEQLQELHEKYGDKIAVLGVPANNFGGQEPGSHEEIASFCKMNYGVTFQMFEKISVKGEDQHPLYQWLKAQTGEEPSWNFCKYIIDENGKAIKFFASRVNPVGEEVVGML